MTERRCACGASLEGLRPQARTCSARCRKRQERGDDYVLTDEDRAAIRRVLERDGYGHPGPRLTPDEIRAHVAATATRTSEPTAEEASDVPRPTHHRP